MNVKTIPVLLPSIDDSQQLDQNLEPQHVRIRSNNNALLYLDSADRIDQQPFNDFSLNKATVLSRKIKRFALDGAQFMWSIPNVNEKNNVITFFSTTSLLNHSVTVPQGFYDFTTIQVAMVTALNTVSGASGLTWSTSAVPAGGMKFNLNVAGGTYHFVDCIWITYGDFLVPLPEELTNSASKMTGWCMLTYTRWFDIISFSFYQYTKNPNSTTKYGEKNILARIFMDGDMAYNPSPNWKFFQVTVPKWVNFEISQNIANIDIKIYDEFGNLLFLPTEINGAIFNCDFDLLINTEL